MRGGVRPNSGIKKGYKYKTTKEKQLKAELAREHFVNFFMLHWSKVEEAVLYLVEKKDPRGIQIAMDYCIGKPKQEISGEFNMPQLDQLAIDVRNILEKKTVNK